MTAAHDGVRHSALYRGTVTHVRTGPVEHSFHQPVTMPLVDLDEVAALCRLHPLWSDRRRRPVEFRRRDFLGDPAVPLAESVRRLVAERTGARPAGRIAVLANLRTWGWLFNPISCYFCYDRAGERVEWLVAEVTNTPWHERHAYVVGPPGEHELDKALHVSPFFGMDQTYRLRYGEPGPRLGVELTVLEHDAVVLRASMSLCREPVTRRALGRMAARPLEASPGVSAGIYRNAVALWRKGATFHPNPGPPPAATAAATTAATTAASSATTATDGTAATTATDGAAATTATDGAAADQALVHLGAGDG